MGRRALRQARQEDAQMRVPGAVGVDRLYGKGGQQDLRLPALLQVASGGARAQHDAGCQGTEAPEQGVGLASVEDYSSVEGIPVSPDHNYEMVSTYQNDTGVPQDAMATFFIYFYDAELDARLDSVRAELAAQQQTPVPGV